MKKIICYGAGNVFDHVIRMLNPKVCDVIAVIDRQIGKAVKLPNNGLFWNVPQSWGGGVTLPLESLNDLSFDYILLCSDIYHAEMAENLKRLGVPTDKIVIASDSETNFDYRSINLSWLYGMNTSTNHNTLHELSKGEMFEHVLCRELVVWRERLISNFQAQIYEDYVRVSTIELLANRIHSQNIQGSIAEAGVFQGTTSALLNEMFPERDLYLFDTFESFTDEVMSKEQDTISDSFIEMFKSTSVELVLSKMKYPNRCIVRKGVFPDTAQDLTEMKFALVSLDVDLYESTYAGLEYFYPRLQEHGYIIIHDCEYHQDKSGNVCGAGRALEKFCEEYNLQYVPLTDIYGSAVLTK